jgi:hypothetical protein
MAQYKVISDICSLGSKGDLVDSEKHEGINFDALVEGAHVEPAKVKTETKEDK